MTSDLENARREIDALRHRARGILPPSITSRAGCRWVTNQRPDDTEAAIRPAQLRFMSGDQHRVRSTIGVEPVW
jgi:hypothetical protein